MNSHVEEHMRNTKKSDVNKLEERGIVEKEEQGNQGELLQRQRTPQVEKKKAGDYQKCEVTRQKTPYEEEGKTVKNESRKEGETLQRQILEVHANERTLR